MGRAVETRRQAVAERQADTSTGAANTLECLVFNSQNIVERSPPWLKMGIRGSNPERKIGVQSAPTLRPQAVSRSSPWASVASSAQGKRGIWLAPGACPPWHSVTLPGEPHGVHAPRFSLLGPQGLPPQPPEGRVSNSRHQLITWGKSQLLQTSVSPKRHQG